jgi:hypothetical protein
MSRLKVILAVVIGILVASSPTPLRIIGAAAILLFLMKYREDEGRMRMVALTAIGFSIAMFPSPWHAMASGLMLYLVYKKWEDAGFLGLLAGGSMVTTYMFFEYAVVRLGWFYGERIFYLDAATAFLLSWVLFHVGIGVTAISTSLIFMRVIEEALEEHEITLEPDEAVPAAAEKTEDAGREPEEEKADDGGGKVRRKFARIEEVEI